jgi:hypothetical protein
LQNLISFKRFLSKTHRIVRNDAQTTEHPCSSLPEPQIEMLNGRHLTYMPGKCNHNMILGVSVGSAFIAFQAGIINIIASF